MYRNTLLLLLPLALGWTSTSRALEIQPWLEKAGNPPNWLHLIQEEGTTSKTLLTWNHSAEPQGGPPTLDEPLASDRPDFTEASCTVGRGTRQLEMGYTYQYDDGANRVTAHSFPELLFRMGVLADWLELRVGWNYGVESTEILGASTRVSGSDPLYLGAKVGLTPQQGLCPEMAIMPQMNIVLNRESDDANVVFPGLNWLYGWEINDRFSTGGSTQINLESDPETLGTYTEFAQSWTIGYSMNEKLSSYMEWFMFAPMGADSARTEHYFDGGFTFLVTNNLQLDLRLGKGVSAAATDFFAGTGAVVRW